MDPALYASYVDEGDGAGEEAVRPLLPGNDEGPVVASSGIRFLQYIGKYLHLMVQRLLPCLIGMIQTDESLRTNAQVLLRPISFEIFVGVTHLFQYYIYTVSTFFAKPKEDPEAGNSNKIVSMVAAGMHIHVAMSLHHSDKKNDR